MAEPVLGRVRCRERSDVNGPKREVVGGFDIGRESDRWSCGSHDFRWWPGVEGVGVKEEVSSAEIVELTSLGDSSARLRRSPHAASTQFSHIFFRSRAEAHPSTRYVYKQENPPQFPT